MSLFGPRQPTSVLVYCGKGCFERSTKNLFQSLKSAVDSSQHNVRYISADEVKEGSWVKTSQLIAFGGGYDLGFQAALGTEGARCIREFVEGGGSYLGLCAGAYWASDYIEFDKGGNLEVVGDRPLKFYMGKCIGPAFPGFQYGATTGVHAVPVSYRGIEAFDTYMEGGGYFEPYVDFREQSSTEDLDPQEDLRLHRESTLNRQNITPSQNGVRTSFAHMTSDSTMHTNKMISSSQTCMTTLGSYTSLKNSPVAIVRCHVGLGMAILSGIHLEFSVDYLDPEDPNLKLVIPYLKKSEATRLFVWKDILKQCGIKCMEQPACLGEEDFTEFVSGHPDSPCTIPKSVWRESLMK